MSRLAGVFRNLFNSVFRMRQNVKCVGADEYGNKYFERLADKAHNLKGARWVESINRDPMQAPDVPTEWDSWLKNKRQIPPTPEEIEKNYMTMVRTQARARELEEKEMLEAILKGRNLLQEGANSILLKKALMERYQEEQERPTVDANLGDFVKNVTREQDKKQFPKHKDYEEKPGIFMDKKFR